ncbi:MAG: hypothetical protein WCP59_12735 [Actinomycetota bacterium]|jgi:hypothetical protein
MASKQDRIWDLERELREERKNRISDQERYEKHLEGRRSRIEELEAKIVQRDSQLEVAYRLMCPACFGRVESMIRQHLKEHPYGWH